MQKYLIVSATSFEIAPLIDFLDENAEKESFFSYIYQGNHITPLVTGIGSMITAFGIATYPKLSEIDLAINVGLAGSFHPHLDKGTVVNVISDRLSDLGVEEANGSFTDVFELELQDPDKFPFKQGVIRNERVKDMPSCKTDIAHNE